MRSYRQNEVQEIFSDVPGKTLIAWARQGLVEWESETKDARGLHRNYSFWNIVQYAVVRELASIGLNSYTIRTVMDSWFKDFLQGPPGPAAEFLTKNRKRKASESNIVEKAIIINKHKIGRESKVDMIGPLDISKISEHILREKTATSIVLNLPVMVKQLEDKIKAIKLK
jgi:DNA-binding transcriptional MerR regulator